MRALSCWAVCTHVGMQSHVCAQSAIHETPPPHVPQTTHRQCLCCTNKVPVPTTIQHTQPQACPIRRGGTARSRDGQSAMHHALGGPPAPRVVSLDKAFAQPIHTAYTHTQSLQTPSGLGPTLLQVVCLKCSTGTC